MSTISKSLNGLLADALVFFVKLHNYHWNVTGPQFESIHAKTEGLYEYFSTLYDDLAERILQLGDKPIVTIAEALDNARIGEESNTTFNDREVLHGIIHDLQTFHSNIKEAKGLPECDSVTSALLDETLAKIEKDLWIFKATLN